MGLLLYSLPRLPRADQLNERGQPRAFFFHLRLSAERKKRKGIAGNPRHQGKVEEINRNRTETMELQENVLIKDRYRLLEERGRGHSGKYGGRGTR